MTVPQTLPVTLSSVITEVGATAPLGLNDPRLQKMGGGVSPFSLLACKGATFIRTNANNINLFTLCGSPSGVNTWKFVVNTGVTIGSTAVGTPAVTVGAFPSGSTVIIDNYGLIGGAGGVPNSGAGGIAISSTTTGLTVSITNRSGATIAGGGGAGGAGGTGGTGGQGGGGVFTTGGITNEGPNYTLNSSDVVTGIGIDTSQDSNYLWGGVSKGTSDNGTSTIVGNDGWTYTRNAFQQNTGVDNSAKGGSDTRTAHYAIARSLNTTTNNFTSGGAGGAGGGGGNGGRGAGTDAGLAAGTGGSTGSAGSAGGTNAGTGGTGGTGGSGGAGGTIGNNGTAGGQGATGGTGTSGNNGAGAGGAAGAAGAAGGSAGYYLFRNGTTVSITNFGTLAGLNA